MGGGAQILKTLCFLGLVLASLVIILGAYTRLVDAGLGCPDWPGCYGFIGVPESASELRLAQARFPDAPVEPTKAWPEMAHRYFAMVLGFLALIILVVAWTRKAPLTMPLILASLVVVQGAFGAWTVIWKLLPQVVTVHLLGGMATLTALWLYWLKLARPRAMVGGRKIPPALCRHAGIAVALVVLQIALGGWTSSNYAALACPDFPTCHGSLLPEMDFARGFNLTQDIGRNYLGGVLTSEARVAIQMVHRLGALIVLIMVGSLACRLDSPYKWVVGGALAAQLGLGIGNVLLNLPVVVATLHNAVGTLLLLTLVTVYAAALGAIKTEPTDSATPETGGI
jgi:cytochrome c oxidase assembly protein subunit 15